MLHLFKSINITAILDYLDKKQKKKKNECKAEKGLHSIGQKQKILCCILFSITYVIFRG